MGDSSATAAVYRDEDTWVTRSSNFPLQIRHFVRDDPSALSAFPEGDRRKLLESHAYGYARVLVYAGIVVGAVGVVNSRWRAGLTGPDLVDFRCASQ